MLRRQRRKSFTAEAQRAQSKTRQEKISANRCEPLRSLRLCGEGYLFPLAN